MASDYWLSKQAALNGPPKYCSAKCYENRGQPGASQQQRRSLRTTVDYKTSESPTQKNGLPWIGMQPKTPQAKLPLRSQNTIKFWDFALNSYTDELTDLEYNAFLFEFVARRSSPHPQPVELEPCWKLWPYIEPYLDDRYSPTMFQRFCQNYLYTERAYCKKEGCMTPIRLDMLIMQCVNAIDEHRAAENNQDKKNPQQLKATAFAERWLRPMIHRIAPYDHPNKNEDNNLRGHYSRIQLEIRRIGEVNARMSDDDLRLGVLEPLTQPQYQAMMDIYKTIVAFYSEALFTDGEFRVPNMTRWPWGVNCYPALVAAHTPSVLDTVKWEMRTTPKYNLPEPY